MTYSTIGSFIPLVHHAFLSFGSASALQYFSFQRRPIMLYTLPSIYQLKQNPLGMNLIQQCRLLYHESVDP